MEVKVPLTSKRFDSTKKDDYKLYILDGQQRLTTLHYNVWRITLLLQNKK